MQQLRTRSGTPGVSTGRCPSDPLFFFRKTDRKGHFCRDIWGAFRGLSEILYAIFSYVPFQLPRMRMRMRILTRPETSQANFRHRISNKKLRIICVAKDFAGKKKAYTALLQSRTFLFAERNGGHRRKISVVDMAFLIFLGFLYPPPAWKVFL